MLVFVLYAVCSCIRLFCVEVRAMAAKVWAGVGVSFYSDCREVHAKLGLTCRDDANLSYCPAVSLIESWGNDLRSLGIAGGIGCEHHPGERWKRPQRAPSSAVEAMLPCPQAERVI